MGFVFLPKHGRSVLFAVVVTCCAIPQQGRAFVPIPGATPKLNTRHVAAIDSRSSCAAALLSSPFENLDDFDEDDVTRRESEQLEEMIRDRRGIIIEMVEREWKEEMSNTMRVDGERLCAQAYEGFQARGRGAIFVNVDLGLNSNNKGHEGAANHVVFRTLEEVVTERSSRVKPSDQMQIIQRCQDYDPEAGFVMVFGHKGMLGVQVMRPSVPPREVHRAQRSSRQ